MLFKDLSNFEEWMVERYLIEIKPFLAQSKEHPVFCCGSRNCINQVMDAKMAGSRKMPSNREIDSTQQIGSNTNLLDVGCCQWCPGIYVAGRIAHQFGRTRECDGNCIDASAAAQLGFMRDAPVIATNESSSISSSWWEILLSLTQCIYHITRMHFICGVFVVRTHECGGSGK